MKKRRTIIFSDFDGTFTEKDIGYRLFRHFSQGRNIPLVKRWKKGLVSSRDCLLEEAAMIRVSLDEIHLFLEKFNLSPGAVDFYRIIKRQNIPFYIVSDGLDIYLEHVLKRHGLDEIEFFCNRGTIKDRQLILSFPYDNDGCKRCGCCKGVRINDLIKSDRAAWEVIFIGDGLSDICAVPHADIIFARGDFLDYCRAKNVNAIEYGNFFDILKCLEGSGHISG